MKLGEYKQLSEPEQYRLLWEDGILIDACLEGDVKKLLYALNNFYIELWCHAITNKIIWKLSFKQGRLLEKYLEKYTLPQSQNPEDSRTSGFDVQ